MATIDPLAQLIETACEAAIKRAMNIADFSPRRLLTTKDTAIYLAISEREVYNMLANNELQSVRHGRRVMVDIRDTERWIENNKT